MKKAYAADEISVGPCAKSFIIDPLGLHDTAARISLTLTTEDFPVDPKVNPDIAHVPSTPPLCEVMRSAPDANVDEPYLIVGFDTEFKVPPAVTLQELRSGGAKYLVLSYQFRAVTSNGIEWEGICLPDGDQRISVPEFLLFVLGMGARQYGIRNLPSKIYIVGHFTRADVSAFADFQAFAKQLEGVRGTFASVNIPVSVEIDGGVGSNIELSVHLRDTILLMATDPDSDKSLRSLGELVGVEKVELHEDADVRLEMISNMDVVRSTNWPLFRRYAMTDAVICVLYLQRIIRLYFDATGKFKVPLTLSGIGVDLLLKHWADEGSDPITAVGKQRHKERKFDKKSGKYRTVTTPVKKELLHLYDTLISDCYHGGRNEQYWFGPGFDDSWTDFDLTGAYPTAMSAMCTPQWDDMRPSTDITEYGPLTMGYAVVEFEFPHSVRYPTLPVRSEGGLIFPRKGRSSCSAPEIYLARKLNARLKIVTGVIVPQDDTPIFSGFISYCISKRYAAGKKSLEGQFWKEISNSTYGKLAQGLKERRIYDMRAADMKPLPPSKITNSAYSAYTTSFTRAVLGDLMNSIPQHRIVFSCTTDGFITNTSDAEMEVCENRLFGRMYSALRANLTNTPELLEKKHVLTKPLGWRTRGQATLVKGNSDAHENFVLAKAGISVRRRSADKSDQNDEIVKMFLSRKFDDTFPVIGKAGLRDMIESDSDLVSTKMDKRLNMEYDWKRRPSGITTSQGYSHIAFTTEPWEDIDDYNFVRSLWSNYNKTDLHCLKSMQDFRLWASYLYVHSIADGTDVGKYLGGKDGDIKRLRQVLCTAFKHGEAGIKFKMKVTNEDFADMLIHVGVPCSKANVENGKKQEYAANMCIPTDRVMDALLNLRKLIPKLKINDLLYQGTDGGNVIDLTTLKSNNFLDKVT